MRFSEHTTAFFAPNRLFDLNGATKTASMKQNRANIVHRR
jgi:hypothetical protein